MKKVLLAFFWFPAVLTIIILSLFLFLASSRKGLFFSPEKQKRDFLSVKRVLGVYNTYGSSIIAADARPEIVARFLKKYQSPLLPYAKLLVETADRYNLDFRLLPAIAMQESNLCHKIPANSYNCWGFGIYADKVLRFNSYQEAIETVAKTLSKIYSRKGLLEPEDIMKRYTPQSRGSWAFAILHFMKQMR